jgi:hypothetical protein
MSIKGSGAERSTTDEEVIEAIIQPGSIHLVLRDVPFGAGSANGCGYLDLRLLREPAVELEGLR